MVLGSLAGVVLMFNWIPIAVTAALPHADIGKIVHANGMEWRVAMEVEGRDIYVFNPDETIAYKLELIPLLMELAIALTGQHAKFQGVPK